MCEIDEQVGPPRAGLGDMEVLVGRVRVRVVVVPVLGRGVEERLELRFEVLGDAEDASFGQLAEVLVAEGGRLGVVVDLGEELLIEELV